VTGASALGGRRFPRLDGLRALGALMVVTTHVGFQSGDALVGPFNGLLARMDSGVAIFFVISGFLLGRPYFVAWMSADSRPALPGYFWHRALRILPALWLAVLLSWLLIRPEDAAPGPYLQHAALIQIYSTDNAAYGLTQMWSLATEAAFYVALPLLGWLLTRGEPTSNRLGLVCLLLVATPLLGATWMGFSAAYAHPLWALWLPGFIGWFGLGMLLALWEVAMSTGRLRLGVLPNLITHRGTVWGLAVALYFVAMSLLAGPYSLLPPTPGEAMTKSLLYSAFGFLIVLPAAFPLLDRSKVGTPDPVGRATTFLGNISYGIFCYHLIVLKLVEAAIGHEAFRGNFVTLWTLTVAGSILVATCSYYLIERPIIRWGRTMHRSRNTRRRDQTVTERLDPETGSASGKADAARRRRALG